VIADGRPIEALVQLTLVPPGLSRCPSGWTVTLSLGTGAARRSVAVDRGAALTR
jgi:hypothetical protein